MADGVKSDRFLERLFEGRDIAYLFFAACGIAGVEPPIDPFTHCLWRPECQRPNPEEMSWHGGVLIRYLDGFGHASFGVGAYLEHARRWTFRGTYASSAHSLNVTHWAPLPEPPAK